MVGCKDKNIYIFFLDKDENVKISGHNGAVNSLAEIDQNTIVSGGWDGVFKIFDLNTL